MKSEVQVSLVCLLENVLKYRDSKTALCEPGLIHSLQPEDFIKDLKIEIYIHSRYLVWNLITIKEHEVITKSLYVPDYSQDKAGRLP